MFVDNVKIKIKAGNGGNGCVSFHRAKYVTNGGPDGGDGGRGGDIVFIANPHMNTLLDFRYKKSFVADNGKDGGKTNMSGKAAAPLEINVPHGTIIKELESGKVMADMANPNERRVLLKGGKGGKGNQHFATSRRQAPRYAERGREGAAYDVVLELKMIADVGIIGLPNVGKSTLLSMVSNAKPKIANYHFTTLSPNLGIVRNNSEDMILADIPGIVEGASRGIGLGIEFLRHVERTRLLIHVLDVSGLEGCPVNQLKVLEDELYAYNPKLLELPRLIACNKMDIGGELDEVIKATNLDIYPISAATNSGLDELIHAAFGILRSNPTIKVFDEDFEPFMEEEQARQPFNIVHIEDGYFAVEGVGVEKMMGYTNIETEKGFAFLGKYLKERGIIEALEQAGVEEGDTVRIYDVEFEYFK